MVVRSPRSCTPSTRLSSITVATRRLWGLMRVRRAATMQPQQSPHAGYGRGCDSHYHSGGQRSYPSQRKNTVAGHHVNDVARRAMRHCAQLKRERIHGSSHRQYTKAVTADTLAAWHGALSIPTRERCRTGQPPVQPRAHTTAAHARTSGPSPEPRAPDAEQNGEISVARSP